jgi:hypothetical protein
LAWLATALREFTHFLAAFMGLATRYSGNGAIHQICIDWRHMGEVLAAARDLYEFKGVNVAARLETLCDPPGRTRRLRG